METVEFTLRIIGVFVVAVIGVVTIYAVTRLAMRSINWLKIKIK